MSDHVSLRVMAKIAAGISTHELPRKNAFPPDLGKQEASDHNRIDFFLSAHCLLRRGMPSELSPLKLQNHKISISLLWMEEGGKIVNSIHLQILLTEYAVQMGASYICLNYFCQIINHCFHSSPQDIDNNVHYWTFPQSMSMILPHAEGLTTQANQANMSPFTFLFLCLDKAFPWGLALSHPLPNFHSPIL